MADEREHLRAADADRAFVAEQLRGALDEGRLNLGEYDERLQQAYAARTYGELDRVMADLPPVAPAQQSRLAPVPPGQVPAQAAAHGPGRVPGWLIATWGSWFTTSLICTVIWLATGTGGSFWPIWVIGPWGAVLLGRTVMGLAGGAGGQTGPAREQRRAERERRNQRRLGRD